MDGVLVDTMKLHAKAWQEAAAKEGLRLRRLEVYEWEGEPGVVTAKRLLKREGRAAAASTIKDLLKRKEGNFRSLAHHIRVEDRLIRLLSQLRKKHVPLALVTGTSIRELRIFLAPKILRHFSVLITADHVEHGKPHPEPYRKAFKKLGIASSKILVVENAPYGIRSARRAKAGCIVALASSLPRRFLKEADCIVTTVNRLCQIVERLTSPSLGR